MKAIYAGAIAATFAMPAFAGGMAEPIVEFVPAPPVVVEETTTSSSAAGIVVPLLLLAIIAAAAAD